MNKLLCLTSAIEETMMVVERRVVERGGAGGAESGAMFEECN